jgi:hypothetical protein
VNAWDASDPRHRYRNDPTFHHLVEMLRGLLRGAQTTPSELREALLLAAYIEEMENPTPAHVRLIELSGRLLEDSLKNRPVPR